MAFQIQDDILDQESSSKALGKTAGSDQNHVKMTYPYVYGIDKAKKKVTSLTEEAISILKPIKKDTDILNALALFLVNRIK